MNSKTEHSTHAATVAEIDFAELFRQFGKGGVRAQVAGEDAWELMNALPEDSNLGSVRLLRTLLGTVVQSYRNSLEIP